MPEDDRWVMYYRKEYGAELQYLFILPKMCGGVTTQDDNITYLFWFI